MQGPQHDGLTKENLIRLYIEDESASIQSVADRLGCHRETVRRWLGIHGLASKPRTRTGPRKAKELADKEWLEEQLQSKMVKEIAVELDCSEGIVSYWIYQHGIWTKDDGYEGIKEGLRKRYPDGRSGKQAANWKGGRRILPNGYVYIYAPDHPRATKAGAVMEHRLVAEEYLGRYLEPYEIVHHKDGDKSHNAWENLEVATRSQHVSNHFNAIHKVAALEERVAELEAENARLLAELEQYREEAWGMVADLRAEEAWCAL